MMLMGAALTDMVVCMDERRISGPEAQRRIARLADELDEIAGLCWSPAGATAIRAASKIVRVLAAGLHHSFRPGERAPEAGEQSRP